MMVPEGAVDFVPSSVTLFAGSVIICVVPALAIGGKGAGLTFIVTIAVDVPPLLSVIFN